MPLANIVHSQQLDQAFLWLLTFEDAANNVTLRAVNNLDAITSRSVLYEPFPFNLVLPPDDGKKPQVLNLVFPNVGRELMQMVREYDPNYIPQVKFELILSDAPDVVEKTIDFMNVTNVEFDAQAITFTLASSSIFARKTCTGTYNQAEFPGLFWALK